jgi:hypothetical protein
MAAQPRYPYRNYRALVTNPTFADSEGYIVLVQAQISNTNAEIAEADKVLKNAGVKKQQLVTFSREKKRDIKNTQKSPELHTHLEVQQYIEQLNAEVMELDSHIWELDGLMRDAVTKKQKLTKTNKARIREVKDRRIVMEIHGNRAGWDPEQAVPTGVEYDFTANKFAHDSRNAFFICEDQTSSPSSGSQSVPALSSGPSIASSSSGTLPSSDVSEATGDYIFDFGAYKGTSIHDIPYHYKRMLAGQESLLRMHPGLMEAFNHFVPNWRTMTKRARGIVNTGRPHHQPNRYATHRWGRATPLSATARNTDQSGIHSSSPLSGVFNSSIRSAQWISPSLPRTGILSTSAFPSRFGTYPSTPAGQHGSSHAMGSVDSFPASLPVASEGSVAPMIPLATKSQDPTPNPSPIKPLDPTPNPSPVNFTKIMFLDNLRPGCNPSIPIQTETAAQAAHPTEPAVPEPLKQTSNITNKPWPKRTTMFVPRPKAKPSLLDEPKKSLRMFAKKKRNTEVEVSSVQQ